jgi:hypothetical protein
MMTQSTQSANLKNATDSNLSTLGSIDHVQLANKLLLELGVLLTMIDQMHDKAVALSIELIEVVKEMKCDEMP